MDNLTALQAVVGERGYFVGLHFLKLPVGTIIKQVIGDVKVEQPFRIVGDTTFEDFAEQARLVALKQGLIVKPGAKLEVPPYAKYYRMVTD